jgi:hypothetical protein
MPAGLGGGHERLQAIPVRFGEIGIIGLPVCHVDRLRATFSNASKKQKLTVPRIETADCIVSVGAKENGTFDEALSIATRDMLRWLVQEHRLTDQEAHLLIGLRARYDVVTINGRIGLRIARADLR